MNGELIADTTKLAQGDSNGRALMLVVVVVGIGLVCYYLGAKNAQPCKQN